MKQEIIIEETKHTPVVYFEREKRLLVMRGRSIPENPEQIFRRLDEWITLHFEKNEELSINIQLEYINSGSSKYLYEILKKLTVYGRTGKIIKIKWRYEEDDEAMLELGEHYRDTAGIPLEIEMIV